MRELAFSALVLLASAAAQAQDDTPAGETADDTERARALARDGHQAMVETRWADAYAALDEAYRLAPLPQILVNLAGAELQTGLVRAAIAHYEAFLRATAGDPSLAALRRSAEEALEVARGRLGRLSIRAEGALPNDRIELDGAQIPEPDRDGRVPVDPGAHTASLIRDGQELVEEPFEIAPGATVEIVLRGPPPEANLRRRAPRPVAPGHDGGGGVLASPWLWLAVAVLAVGAGVGVWFLVQEGTATPAMPNTMPGVLAFD